MKTLAVPLLLVRVQDELHGASLVDGVLRLPFDRQDSERNTMHFSVNSIVSDHAYGKFNENEDGSLRGKIVILADPSNLPQAAGFGQVDTWFRLSGARDPSSGCINRWLDVGDAVVVAPAGTQVPGGVRAVFYEGGIEARNAAVQGVFDDRGICMEQAWFRNWLGHDWGSSDRWARDMSQTLWGEAAKHTHIGGHDSSIDEAMVRSSVSGLMKSLDLSRLYLTETGCDVPCLDVIRERVQKSIALIDGFSASGLPAEEMDRCAAHCEAQCERLQRDLTEAVRLDAGWQRAANLRNAADEIGTIPGQGPFFLGKRGCSSPEATDDVSLAVRLTDGSTGPDHLIWRKGMAADWMAVKDSPLALLLAEQPAPSTVSTPFVSNFASSFASADSTPAPAPMGARLPSLVPASPLAHAPPGTFQSTTSRIET